MAKAEVVKSGISPIWILPIVTVIIGVILAVSSFTNRGHRVVLITSDAEGIVAGRTVIKSRSVDVGVIESIELSEDFSHAILYGMIDKNKSELLRTDSLFWTVSPRVSTTGVSGLSTIFSGAYIELKPGSGEHIQAGHTYSLQKYAPASAYDISGLRLYLISELESVVNAGSPVLYRGLNVGRVDSTEFDVQKKQMRYSLFIESTYESLVTENVHFWLSGDFNLELSGTGMVLELPSISTILTGGISFDLPPGSEAGKQATKDSVFTLYESRKSSNVMEYSIYREYLLFFDSSVDGLIPEAPVSFRGIRIGTVKKVPFIADNMSIRSFVEHIPVLVRIEPQRVISEPDKAINEIEYFLTGTNLRATLKTSNILTGALYVDIDNYAKPQSWNAPADTYGYKVIPTTSSSLVLIENKIINILNKLEELQLNPIVEEVSATMAEIRGLGENLNGFFNREEVKGLPSAFYDTMTELQNTMNTMSAVFSEGSPLYDGATRDLHQLEALLKEARSVMQTINEKSNALIFNADKPADPLPAAPRR